MNTTKKAFVAVSFGSTVESALETISGVENAMAEVCTDRDFFRAFSSSIVRKRLAAKGIAVSSPADVLEELAEEGYTDVVLQPTHIIPGFEFDKVSAAVESYRSRFETMHMGTPLVTNAEALVEIAEVLNAYYGTAEEKTAILFMGHGTEHLANFIFPALQTAFRSIGKANAYVATVEGWPELDSAIGQMRHDGIEKVILAPFLLVAGDHVLNDMQGDEEDSWKNVLTRAGFRVECRCTGLGEIPGIRQMYRSHAEKLIAE